MAEAWRAWVTLLLAFAVGAAAGFPRLPAALSTDAPAGTFAAGRAMEHVRAWAREPRPSGSPAHAAVLDGLEAELSALGFAVEREPAVVQRPSIGVTRLLNLVAQPGPDPRVTPTGASGADAPARTPSDGPARTPSDGPAAPSDGPAAPDTPPAAPAVDQGVWLVAHSDSVPGSPGAADDGLGLAVVVEAARALSVDGVPPGLHVLVTDAEEQGLYGALAHARRAAGVRRLVLNVEARGTEGPAYMFQTAGPEGPLLDAWRRSGCAAQATSLARAVYERLPNDTDFTIFRRAGWWGYDFALIHGAWRYHTPDDVPAALDPRSVQHVGDCVVGLARAWLGTPLAEGPADEVARVYAQAFGRTFVLPPWAVRGAAAAALLGLALALRGARGRALVAGAGAWLAALAGALVAGIALSAALVRARPDFWVRPAEMEGPGPAYALAVTVGAGVAAALLFAARRLAPDAPRGWHAVAALSAAAIALAAPTVGYVLVPGALAGAALVAGRPGFALVPAAAGGLLLAPVLHAIFPALTTRMTPVLCVVPVLLLAWLAPPPRPIRASRSGA